MLTELELQKEIKSKLIALGHSYWQVDSGKKVTYKTRGIGLEKGFPDLFGARKMMEDCFSSRLKSAMVNRQKIKSSF